MSDDVLAALVLGSVFALSGLVSCMVGVYQILRSRRLQREGLTATAIVVNRRVDERQSRSSSGATNTPRWYHVTLRWPGPDGQPLHAENVLPNAKRYEALPEGAEVPIRYLPPSPGSDTRACEYFEFLDEGASQRYGVGCFIWAVIGLGAGGAVLAWGLTQIAK